MNYEIMIEKAIENNEIVRLMCGGKGYEVEVSKFTSDVFPTDINAVLVNCFYKQKDKIDDIAEVFEKNLHELLQIGACETYIAILYFDACIFQEERYKAGFIINKNNLCDEIRESVNKYKNKLQDYIVFDNGMKKRIRGKT